MAPHSGQASGPLLAMAAMMAPKRARETMLDEPGGALRAAESVAASAAERERSIAAPVQEEQRLLARRQASRRIASTSDGRQPAILRGRRIARKIDGGDVRKRAARRPGPADARARNGPISALTRVSIEGVAETSTTGAFSSLARTTAMSRAW